MKNSITSIVLFLFFNMFVFVNVFAQVPENGLVTDKKDCTALATGEGKPIDPKTLHKFSLIKYTDKRYVLGGQSFFQVNSKPVQLNTGDEFISVKGEIQKDKNQVCCKRIRFSQLTRKFVCSNVVGDSFLYGGLNGGNKGGNKTR